MQDVIGLGVLVIDPQQIPERVEQKWRRQERITYMGIRAPTAPVPDERNEDCRREKQRGSKTHRLPLEHVKGNSERDGERGKERGLDDDVGSSGRTGPIELKYLAQ
jgi:hypothetical protein